MNTNTNESLTHNNPQPYINSDEANINQLNDIIFDVPEEHIDDKQAPTSASDELKKNLMFEQKNISVFKLLCHLSSSTEVVLMILGVIGSIASGVAGPLMTLLFGDTIDSFGEVKLGPNDSMSEAEMHYWFSIFVNTTFKETVDDMVNKFLYIGVGMFCAECLNRAMWSLSGLRQIHYMKEKYFALILTQEQGWFDANNAFEFATKVQAQLEQIELGLGDKIGELIQSVSQLITGIIIALTTSWKLTLVMLCVSPAIILCILFLVNSLKTAIILSMKTYEIAGGIAEEMLYNIKTVASFANFDFETSRYNVYIDKCNTLEKEKGFKLAISLGALIFFLQFTSVIAFLYGKKLVADELKGQDGLLPGDVLTVIFSTTIAIMSLGSVAPNIKLIQEAASASSDYFTLVERVPLIDLSESTYKPQRNEIKGKIEFRNISFIYPSDVVNKKRILNGINLVFEPGMKVALVGESGCGKSTTVNLIERLYEAQEGEVLIDGVNIKKYDIQYLRTLIGYVQQEPVLFNKPIRDNIIFGRDDIVKQLGDVDTLMKTACDDAYASDFIEKLPGKLDYVVGIKGSKLSGGQKQRIAIARAILCKPKILILDEATSALDNKSEKEVQRALDNISQKNVTTIIIAHRLSTIKNADLIYAIKDGKVFEQGTHKELLAKNGYYAGLVKSQLTQDELESKESNLNNEQQMQKNITHISRMLSKKVSSQHSSIINQVVNPQSALQLISAKTKNVRLSDIFSLIKGNISSFVFGTIGAFVSGVAMPFQGYILASAVNALQQSDPDEVKDDGLFWAMMFLIHAAVNGMFLFLKIWKYIDIGSHVTSSMRKSILDKYLKLHISYFDIDTNSPGALLTKLSLDTTQINNLVLGVLGDVVSLFGVIVCGFVFAFYYSWRLSLISLCFVPFIVAAGLFAGKTKPNGRDGDKKINIEAGSILSECVVNTKTIYSFNFQKEAVDMYLSILSESKKVFLRDSLIKGLLIGIGLFAVYANNATIFHYAWYFIKEGKLDVNDMNVTMNCIIMLTNGISVNINGLSDYPKGATAFKSIYSTLDTKSLIDTSIESNINKTSAVHVKGRIEFKNVSFAYPSKPDQMILKKVNFVIEPGQKAALVGYSGCGKSTIIQLLERFYDVTEGEVLIDGVNIKEYNLLELRKKIGLVSQEPVLFKRSVYENIKYGKLDATKEEVFNAAKKAKIEKFFNKKEMGTKEDPVSGGEKQRLAIARAFLKNPTILLLDEATSALDKESEIAVQKSINELQKGRTSISVAHRLSTIEDSDVIFVLEAGRVVEKGTHNELMQLGGKYSMLHKYSEA